MKSRYTYIVLLLPMLLLCGAASCFQQKVRTDAVSLQDHAIDAVLDSYVEEGFFPFVYARLESLDGEVIYEHGVVNDALLPDTKVDGNTWIRIWSMSKIVTISVALDLVEDNLLQLDDPVAKYIPEFEDLRVAVGPDGQSLADYTGDDRGSLCPVTTVPNDSVMTIRHLINHQAGFYYATTGFPCLDSLLAEQNIPKAKNSDDLIKKLARLPLIQHSGTKYYYGTNTTVLGLVAERAAGKSLRQLVKERVTDPLQIEGLQYGLPQGKALLPRFTGRDSILREALAGELDIFGPDVPDYDRSHLLYLGGEGMVATADGYADFIRMLVNSGQLNNHRYLEEQTVKDIYAPHTQKDSPYGYNGYNLWVSGDTMRVMEQGDAGLWIGGGYECTYFWADPKRKFVGIVMSQNNEVRAPGYNLNDDFRAAVYKQLWQSEGSH